MKIKFGDLTIQQIASICRNMRYCCEDCIIREICETDITAPRFFDLDKEINVPAELLL